MTKNVEGQVAFIQQLQQTSIQALNEQLLKAQKSPITLKTIDAFLQDEQ